MPAAPPRPVADATSAGPAAGAAPEPSPDPSAGPAAGAATPTPTPTPTGTAGSAPSPAQCRPGTLAGELRVALIRATRRLRMERSSEEITDGQYSVLAALSKLGAQTPGDLAERDHVQPPSMTRTVARLVEMGLVARGEHPTDGRQVLVTITEAGEREVRETRRRRDVWLSQRLAELTPAERATLVQATEILRRIAAT